MSYAFVDDDDAGHCCSSLIFFDRYFSLEVKQAGVDAARASHMNGADQLEKMQCGLSWH